MVKAQAISKFNLGEWDKIKILERADEGNNLNGTVYQGDILECSDEMADYLLSGNKLKRAFIKILEYTPEKKPKEKPIKTRVSKK